MNNNRREMVSVEIAMDDFAYYLKQNEKSQGTIRKYVSDIERYIKWSESNGLDDPFRSEEWAKWVALEYKEYLRRGDNNPSTINVKLASINAFFGYMNYREKIKYIKIQRKIFLNEGRELSVREYRKLVTTARESGNERIALIMETMASTGMRVSELKYVTVESLRSNIIQVDLKNKVRTIFIPKKLSRRLSQYAYERNIEKGEIFTTSSGISISRKQVWSDMKQAGNDAGVASSKVFPHNMRHVFARTYYKQCKDIARLADVLGHSSLETTRIYLMDAGSECERQINSLGLVC